MRTWDLFWIFDDIMSACVHEIQGYDVVDEFLEAAKVAHDVCMVEPCPVCQDAVDGCSEVVR